jgi:hypothetical protein
LSIVSIIFFFSFGFELINSKKKNVEIKNKKKSIKSPKLKKDNEILRKERNRVRQTKTLKVK